MKKPNILVIPSWYPTNNRPGSGIFTKTEIVNINNHNINISVFYSNLSWKSLFQSPNLEIKHEPIVQYRINGFTLPKINYWFYQFWAKKHERFFSQYINDNGLPDLIHAHSFTGGFLAYWFSKKYNIPYIITEHYSGFLLNSITAKQAKIIKTTYDNAQNVIAVSSALAAKMKLFTTNDVTIIGNMYDDKTFNYQSNIKQQTPFKLITIGGLDSIKNHALLLDAIAILETNTNYTLELSIIGDGKLLNTLKTKVNKLNISKKIKFLGLLSSKEISYHLNNSNAYVCSSKVETFGISIIEALACGLPIISTNCQGPSDYLTPTNAIILQENSPEQMVLAIEKMIDNYDIFNNSSIASEIKNNYNSAAISDKIISLYNAIIK